MLRGNVYTAQRVWCLLGKPLLEDGSIFLPLLNDLVTLRSTLFSHVLNKLATDEPSIPLTSIRHIHILLNAEYQTT